MGIVLNVNAYQPVCSPCRPVCCAYRAVCYAYRTVCIRDKKALLVGVPRVYNFAVALPLLILSLRT
jgi:putative component of membrane protein insertase Oxa1/YidC/SpoIIIJ protein YidD